MNKWPNQLLLRQQKLSHSRRRGRFPRPSLENLPSLFAQTVAISRTLGFGVGQGIELHLGALGCHPMILMLCSCLGLYQVLHSGARLPSSSWLSPYLPSPGAPDGSH